MNIENNRYLFLVGVGLTASGSDGYNHADADISRIVEMVLTADFPSDVKNWFARARTSQVAVNPYWPRGSCLASACFFVDASYNFDIDSFNKFLESAGAVSDPIGLDDFQEWISKLPYFLRILDEHPATPLLWDEYSRIVDSRTSEWVAMVEKAVTAAKEFFCSDVPEMVFSPRFLQSIGADFVRIGNRIITISSAPDAESMLHETLHIAIAKYRSVITEFAEVYGLAGFANKDKMFEFGYLEDESASSIAHVIEECFVRAFSVVLSGGNEKRLQSHARYGCDSVPFIASRIQSIRPSYQTLGSFVIDVLSELTSLGVSVGVSALPPLTLS